MVGIGKPGAKILLAAGRMPMISDPTMDCSTLTSKVPNVELYSIYF